MDLGDGSFAVLFAEVTIEPGLPVLPELIAVVPEFESQVVCLLELGELLQLEDLLDAEDSLICAEALNLFKSHLVLLLDLLQLREGCIRVGISVHEGWTFNKFL